jgi:hypothetical protein
MHSRRSTYTVVIVLLTLTVLPNSFAHADETISVRLASGRTFTGLVHARTSSERLWLQFGSNSATLMRPIQWSAVESITHDDQSINQQQVLGLLTASGAEQHDIDREAKADNSIDITIRNAPSEVDLQSHTTDAPDHAPQATHIDFYATLHNWDADPQADGLLLHLQLLDANGQPIAAPGSLQAELFAPVERRFQAVPHGRGASVVPLARWSHTVREQDYRHGEVVLKLPFTAAKPVGTDLAAAYGLLHVRFAVPGHGVLQDSYDGITLRRFTPTRDLLERQGRPRRLFTEPPRREGNVR